MHQHQCAACPAGHACDGDAKTQCTPGSYAAAGAGYFYGSEPVTEVTLLVETIWLRSWTTPFMPDEVKTSLGIPVEAPNDS